MSEEKLVPKLRFSGFNDEWESYKFDDLFNFQVAGDMKKELFNDELTDEFKYPLYANALENEGLLGYYKDYKYESNSITVTARGNIGYATVRKNKFSAIGRLIILTAKINLNMNFFEEYINNNVKVHIESTGVPQLTAPSLKINKINCPNLNEQNKISNFLTRLNKKIELLEKKHQCYQDFKKYLMQQIFTQKLRFRNFNENFNEYLISQLFISKKGSGLSKDMIENDGVNKCVLYGELYTNYSEIISEVQSRTNEECKSLSKYGDILIPSSTTTKGIDLVTASVILDDDVYLGGDITILRNKDDSIVNNSYFAYYFSNGLIKDVSRLTQGSTIIHLYWKDFKKVKVMLPSLEEQEKITNILISIDEKLNEINNIIDSMKEFKKGLLQQMFV